MSNNSKETLETLTEVNHNLLTACQLGLTKQVSFLADLTRAIASYHEPTGRPLRRSIAYSDTSEYIAQADEK